MLKLIIGMTLLFPLVCSAINLNGYNYLGDGVNNYQGEKSSFSRYISNPIIINAYRSEFSFKILDARHEWVVSPLNKRFNIAITYFTFTCSKKFMQGTKTEFYIDDTLVDSITYLINSRNFPIDSTPAFRILKTSVCINP